MCSRKQFTEATAGQSFITQITSYLLRIKHLRIKKQDVQSEKNQTRPNEFIRADVIHPKIRHIVYPAPNPDVNF